MTALTIVQKQAVNIRNCRVASISEANDHVLFEILLGIYIYMSAPYASRCYSCTSLMAAPCAEWHIALLPCSTLVSGFLRSVVFLPQVFRSQSIGFHHSRCIPSPNLLCAGALRSGQSGQRPYRLQIHTGSSPSPQMNVEVRICIRTYI